MIIQTYVATLFHDHPDLLDEFIHFLPDASGAAAVQHGPAGRNSSFLRRDERSFALPSRHMHVDKRDRANPADRDLSVDRPDPDHEKTMLKIEREQRKRVERGKERNEDHNRRDQDHDERDLDHDNTHRLLHKRKASRKVDENQIGEDNEKFGMHSISSSYDDKSVLKSVYTQEFIFCEKVKEKLRNPDDYQEFLKCLHIYSKEIISRSELQSLICISYGNGEHIEVNDEQWLTYWILYSFLQLMDLAMKPVLIWYDYSGYGHSTGKETHHSIVPASFLAPSARLRGHISLAGVVRPEVCDVLAQSVSESASSTTI